MTKILTGLFSYAFIFLNTFQVVAQTEVAPVVPSAAELNAPFSEKDIETFKNPPKVYHPETWFHFIGGNVAKEGITADLEAIAGAGISGVQLFHGQFGGPWPGVSPQIACLSEPWDDAVRFTGEECRRLGLRFTMQNCPGWATSGGPWIEPSNAMRHLAWSRTDVEGGSVVKQKLPVPKPSHELWGASKTGDEDWLDYKDIMVLAFPTPHDDTGEALVPESVKSNKEFEWVAFLSEKAKGPVMFSPSKADNPHYIEVTFTNSVPLRSVEFPSINSFNHHQCYEPGVNIEIQAILPNGETTDVLKMEMPQANSQDNRPITLACSEISGVKTYRISIVNKYPMTLLSLRLFSAARKNSWESEAGWTLRSIERSGESPEQNPKSLISAGQILDVSDKMDEQGNLDWKAPAGSWSILRIGHVNTGRHNSPAPPEGTGWECNKLSQSGVNAQFAGYIGRLTKKDGPLADGLLNGMLLDSWECYTQTWTPGMENEFNRLSGYELRNWLPAVFGYVIDSHEVTKLFLLDWRRTINDLLANNFYGRMAKLAHNNDLYITSETGPGDVFPADIMEYFKYIDVPMCEFWHPHSDSYVGSLNFKPIKPTASAARLYGKPRVSAEAFTSFNLTWDEHLSMLKEVANLNFIEGVTHLVFHTYTHNPRTDWLPPGTSFGSGIGTPFLREQTWWKHMPEFTTYLARLNYLFERGKPVSDVLWYLGDEINHKPDQEAPFPKGYKYDYCNPDVLLNRLSVRDGKIITPEGLEYKVLWLPDNERMLPETLEKLLDLVRSGAIVIGNAPLGLATLKGGESAQQRFIQAVSELWGNNNEKIRTIGKGKVLAGFTISEALAQMDMTPDVVGNDALWLHRQIKGADWYYISSPFGSGFQGELSFNNNKIPEIWNPVSGEIEPAMITGQENGRTTVHFDLPKSGSCFVVFRTKGKIAEKPVNNEKTSETLAISGPWTLSFPAGWGAPESVETAELKAWKDLDISAEAKAFSGTVTYTTTFDAEKIKKNELCTLDLGNVEMIAEVTLNGKPLGTLWTPPYSINITDALKQGKNTLEIKVTGTWFNRLVYDANQPEEQRKTWTISGPNKNEALRESGLLGPVVLTKSL
ncbi:MAG: glycosyl hydrolase [Draconibacterium sp.]